MSTPQLIPVLDVMNGVVVRAVGGRRDEYQPVVSKLTTSTEPLTVANAMLALTGGRELYVADLDAIRGGTTVSPAVLELFEGLGVMAWTDVGLSDQRPPSILPDSWGVWPVVGTETATPADLAGAIRGSDSPPVAVSLDLHDGRLLGNWDAWGAKHDCDAVAVARTAMNGRAKALIVLDLARVGTGTGTGTEPLLKAFRAEFPRVDLIAGGGVKTWADVERLGEAGATGVLVASALHDGTLTARS